MGKKQRRRHRDKQGKRANNSNANSDAKSSDRHPERDAVNHAINQVPEEFWLYLLGFVPVQEEGFEGYGTYDLTGGRYDGVMTAWRTMSKQGKLDVLTVTEDNLLYTLKLLRRESSGLPEAKQVMAIQAECLQSLILPDSPPPDGMQRTDMYPGRPGVVELMNPTFAEVMVLNSIRENLLLAAVKQDLHKQVFFITNYIVWQVLFTWMGWFAAILGVFVVNFLASSALPQCVQVIAAGCRLADLIFIAPGQRDASIVEWQAETWITGFLLMITASRSWYAFIVFLLCLPHALKFIESKSVGFHDTNALIRIRKFFGFVNKLVLLYWAWSKWSAIALVCLLFFPELSTILIGGAFALTGLALQKTIALCAIIVHKTVPAHIREAADRWRRTWHGSLVLYVAFFLFLAWIVWGTWQWKWGGIARFLVLAVSMVVIPSGILDLALRGCALALFVAFNAVNRCILKIGNFFGSKGGKGKRYAYTE